MDRRHHRLHGRRTAGSLAGFVFGSLFDTDSSDAGSYYGEEPTHGTTYTGQRNSFLFSMLVMASYIIRADGRIMHSEMEFVRRFLRSTFGEAAVGEGERILLNLFEQRKQMDRQNPLAFKNTIRDCGTQIAANLTYEERLQLLVFLVEIAKSDGHVCNEEIEALKEVAMYMGLSVKEVESMLNLGGSSLNEAYKVLEIEPTATNDEVRAAYRRLALKHHRPGGNAGRRHQESRRREVPKHQQCQRTDIQGTRYEMTYLAPCLVDSIMTFINIL